MKRALFAFALGLAGLTLTACDDGYGYYGGVYSAGYPHYRYYDDYYYAPHHYGAHRYGPVHRGYWDTRKYHHRRDVHDGSRWRGRHHRDWRRDRD